MTVRRTRSAAWLAFAAGAVHWGLGALLAGGEAWDGAAYWASLPVLGLACASLGAWAPRRPWRLGMSAALAEAIGLAATAGAGASLLPVGVALLALLGAGLGACAWIGAWSSRRDGLDEV